MDWVKPDQVQLWQYVQGLQKLGQLWVESLCQPLESRDLKTFDNPSASSELTDLYWNIYAKTFGNFLQSPSLGYAREFNNKLLKGFDAWINFYKASFDYQVVLVSIWIRAFEELMCELAASEKKGEAIQNWRQFLQVWSYIFDRVFAKAFRSEDTLEVQGRFLNAAITYRLHNQQLMEVFLKLYDLPSRSEMDEVHRSIYELRKEIKALKKIWAESQRQEAGRV